MAPAPTAIALVAPDAIAPAPTATPLAPEADAPTPAARALRPVAPSSL